MGSTFEPHSITRGQNQLIDGRADQFALAAILYYALSGQLPFRGSDWSSFVAWLDSVSVTATGR